MHGAIEAAAMEDIPAMLKQRERPLTPTLCPHAGRGSRVRRGQRISGSLAMARLPLR